MCLSYRFSVTFGAINPAYLSELTYFIAHLGGNFISDMQQLTQVRVIPFFALVVA
jgi:hypothetical protein